MIAYMCKYAPIEIIEAFGDTAVIAEPHASNFNQADTLMHPNICSYVKAVLEDFEGGAYDGMVFTTCCDSARRLYDALCRLHPEKFFFCFDLPRKYNDFAISHYRLQMEVMIEKYAKFSGKDFDEKKLAEICESECLAQERKRELAHEGKFAEKDCDLAVCLAGARPGSDIKKLIENLGAKIELDLTCTGIAREYHIVENDILGSYAKSLLGQIPCMRMGDAHRRREILAECADRLDGIIYHTVKFCDIYSYEYADLKEKGGLPMVKLETDATSQCAGQILTRVEAFCEALKGRKEHAVFLEKGDGHMYICGIDSGSTSTNAVIINEEKKILASAVLRTGAKSGESAGRILAQVLERAGLGQGDLSIIVSTGYGRVGIPFADRNVTEISCHGKGAHFLNPEVRTILDIGGQDSKAIRLDENGDVVDFVMNDKCAAGTGRFLEMMARTLEVGIDELGPLSLKSREDVEISSMCSVFAESEVISLIAQNKDTADIAHGVHKAMAGKAMSLIKRVGPTPAYMMTGGVAKNPGMVRVLEEMLGAPLYIYEEPEIVGALGAALYGLE